MAITTATANGKITLTIKYAAPTAIMTKMLDTLAGEWYLQDPTWWASPDPMPTYATLTTAQRMSIIDYHFKQSLLQDYSRLLNDASVRAQNLARIAAEAEVQAAKELALE